ncbi:MAG: thioredoxin family protein [Candidatus Hydrogenedentota bacterium]
MIIKQIIYLYFCFSLLLACGKTTTPVTTVVQQPALPATDTSALVTVSDTKQVTAPEPVHQPIADKPAAETITQMLQEQSKPKIKVTLIELMSKRCMPCRMMEPVIESIRQKYAGQVEVQTFDVWTPLGKPMAEQYDIRLIPTQIFLDENGKEFFRHEGYLSEKEIIKILNRRGVK